jgi:hypothetical protein
MYAGGRRRRSIDLHSGSFGAASNPANALATIIAALSPDGGSSSRAFTTTSSP